MVALQYKGRFRKAFDSAIDCGAPISVGKVAPEKNTARPPGMFRESGNFQNQLALALRQAFELRPIGNVQFRDGPLRGQRGRINHPGVRDAFEESLKERLTEMLAPKRAQVSIPQERKQGLFLEDCFRWRSQLNLPGFSSRKNLFCCRHVGEVEQFEEAIDGVALLKCSEVGRTNCKSLA